MIKRFEDLKIWEKSYNLVLELYKCDIMFPVNERYNLESQLKRAMVSVPTNIAEGCRRQYKKEFIQFIYIARGSLSEARFLLLLCKDLGFMEEEKWKYFHNECNAVDRMIDGYLKKMQG